STSVVLGESIALSGVATIVESRPHGGGLRRAASPLPVSRLVVWLGGRALGRSNRKLCSCIPSRAGRGVAGQPVLRRGHALRGVGADARHAAPGPRHRPGPVVGAVADVSGSRASG